MSLSCFIMMPSFIRFHFFSPYLLFMFMLREEGEEERRVQCWEISSGSHPKRESQHTLVRASAKNHAPLMCAPIREKQETRPGNLLCIVGCASSCCGAFTTALHQVSRAIALVPLPLHREQKRGNLLREFYYQWSEWKIVCTAVHHCASYIFEIISREQEKIGRRPVIAVQELLSFKKRLLSVHFFSFFPFFE